MVQAASLRKQLEELHIEVLGSNRPHLLPWSTMRWRRRGREGGPAPVPPGAAPNNGAVTKADVQVLQVRAAPALKSLRSLRQLNLRGVHYLQLSALLRGRIHESRP